MKSLIVFIVGGLLLVGCATTQSPNSPLFDAIKKGDIEAVKKHLDAGADVNERNRVRPGTFALMTKRGGVGRAMLGLNPKVTPLDFAISTKNPQAAGLLLKNPSGKYRQQSFHDSFSHPEIADLLRKRGGKTSLELGHVIDPIAPITDLIRKHGGKTGEELKAEGK